MRKIHLPEVSSASRDGDASAAFGCARGRCGARYQHRDRERQDRRHDEGQAPCAAVEDRPAREPARDDCDADAGPDQRSRGGTLFRFGRVEDDEKDGEHAEARGEPGDEAACRHRRNVGRQPADEHGAGEDEMAGAAERQRAHFRVERRRRQRTEQVADEVKRSEQPGGGQAELQVARESREHDPVGDACDADIQADREHRDGQQDE